MTHVRRLFKAVLFLALAGVVFTVAAVTIVHFSNRSNSLGPLPQPQAISHQEQVERLDGSRLRSDSLTRHLEQLRRKAGVHGLAISLINHHELVYQQHFGLRDSRSGVPQQPGTVFYAASFSKVVFVYLVMQLVEEGVLSLDTPLQAYLNKPLPSYSSFLGPGLSNLLGRNHYDYSALLQDERYKRITARMCLSHTTGLPNWRWLEDDQQLKIIFAPGSRYSYSGEGMLLLQFVVEELLQQDFESIVRARVFDPLQMNSSSYVWQNSFEDHYCVGHDQQGGTLNIYKRGSANAAGSLTTTLEDITRFYQTMLQQKGLSTASYHEIFNPQIPITSKQQFGPNALVDTDENRAIALSYGLGVGLYQTPYGKAFFKEGHDAGWQHYFVGFPEQGLAAVIMTNSDRGESIFKELLEVAQANTFTPWYWEGYIPYDHTP